VFVPGMRPCEAAQDRSFGEANGAGPP
jgi:hypothetical protein